MNRNSNGVEECREVFHRLAHGIAQVAGSPWCFLTALVLIAGWAATGPLFHFSDTWQLVVNTATTIVTFLMVFLIQNTQNRDTKAIHLKLDELLRGVRGARTRLVNLEELSDSELDELQREFQRLGTKKNATQAKTPAENHKRA
jgi:low affinity Fe/Cu permease